MQSFYVVTIEDRELKVSR